MRFIHAADIHLDSPLVGLAAYDGAPVDRLRGATRRAFEALVDLAEDEEVDFVVIAGDLYDGDWRDFNTGLFFVQQVARLARRGIPLFLLHGNHDAESQITRRLTLPDTVKAFVKVFPARRPETFELPDLGVVLHGQSFRQREVTDNLAAAYPAPRPGWFNIGVLHTALDGREGHAAYAPCDLAGLVGRGYDYWALGHVHGREVLNEHPHVVFPGNLQGRHIREAGAKGCSLVTVADGRVTACEHRAVDVLRWAAVDADLSGCDSDQEALRRVRAVLEAALADADGRLLACRVGLSGETPLHGRLLVERDQLLADIRALALDVGLDSLWIEKVRPRTRPVRDRSAVSGRPDALGALFGSLSELSGDDGARELVLAELGEILAKLPHEARDGAAGEEIAALADPGRLDELMSEAREIVCARLLERAGEEE